MVRSSDRTRLGREREVSMRSTGGEEGGETSLTLQGWL